MGYIIIWRNSQSEPFVDVDLYDFLQSYSTYEEAKAFAEEIEERENSGKEQSPWWFDYKIYEEANS